MATQEQKDKKVAAAQKKVDVTQKQIDKAETAITKAEATLAEATATRDAARVELRKRQRVLDYRLQEPVDGQEDEPDQEDDEAEQDAGTVDHVVVTDEAAFA